MELAELEAQANDLLGLNISRALAAAVALDSKVVKQIMDDIHCADCDVAYDVAGSVREAMKKSLPSQPSDEQTREAKEIGAYLAKLKSNITRFETPYGNSKPSDEIRRQDYLGVIDALGAINRPPVYTLAGYET